MTACTPRLTVRSAPAPIGSGAVPLAGAMRGGLVESVHYGHVVEVAGDEQTVLGDADAVMFARSTLKPFQTLAMVRAGLELPAPLLALVCSSHSAEQQHRDAVVAILASVGLTIDALQATPSLPLGVQASRDWLAAGHSEAPIAHDCSGKHSGMLATCVINGWPVDSYLDPDHPLQRAIRETVAECVGPADEVSVDGCGAPLFSSTLMGLARGYQRLATSMPGSAEGRIYHAMSAHPDMVGGTGRLVTKMMCGVPGLVAKDGAEAVLGFALPDGRAAAIKVADSGARAMGAVADVVLRRWGVGTDQLAGELQVDILGHGKPVGVVAPVDGLFDIASGTR